MTTDARKRSWRRYDDKRRGSQIRLLKERARNVARGLPRSGQCELCGFGVSATVMHHTDYRYPRDTIEVCIPCHRLIHRRPMPHGGEA